MRHIALALVLVGCSTMPVASDAWTMPRDAGPRPDAESRTCAMCDPLPDCETPAQPTPMCWPQVGLRSDPSWNAFCAGCFPACDTGSPFCSGYWNCMPASSFSHAHCAWP